MGPRGYAREAILSVSSVELVAAIVVISRGLDASIVDRNGPCKSLWLGYFVDREVVYVMYGPRGGHDYGYHCTPPILVLGDRARYPTVRIRIFFH